MTHFSYWLGREPDGEPKTLLVKAGMRPEDASYPRPKKEILEKWCKENGWTKDTKNTIVVSCSDWRSLASYYLAREPDNEDGKVTPEIVAEFLCSGMQGFYRLEDWWQAYLDILKELGYSVDYVVMDWEANFMSGWKYIEEGKTVFDMHDVVEAVDKWPCMKSQFPRLHPPSWNAKNIYGNPAAEQSITLWNHWVSEMQSRRLADVFFKLTDEAFPEAHVSNYNCIHANGGPLISWPHSLPQSLPAVGSSGFLAYLSADTGYRTIDDVKTAFGAIADPEGCCVWVWHWDRSTKEWPITKEQYEELVAWFISQGVRVIMVF